MQIINTISSFLKKWPLHLLLLPVFFIANIYVQLAGLLPLSEFAWAFLKVTGYLLLFFAVLYAFFKDKAKAGLIATLGGIVFLFFGAIKTVLGKLPVLEYISSYKVLLPLLLLLFIFLIYKTNKVRSSSNVTLFLNILFIIYLGIESYTWYSVTNYEKSGVAFNPPHPTGHPALEKLPGIYYIVFDSYPSSIYQQQVLGIRDNPLDSQLTSKGFFVVPEGISNYHLTSFSLASTFGMEYLEWMKEVSVAKPYHYSRSATAVMKAPVFDWLKMNDYRLYNLSIFDLPGQPSINKEQFFTATNKEIIFYTTLWSRCKWEVMPYLFPARTKKLIAQQEQDLKSLTEHYKQYNTQVLDSLNRLFYTEDHTQRKFVYAHLEMPHYPYFYDSTGQPYPDKIVFGSPMTTNKSMFLNYIGYTNHIINNLLDSLLYHNKGRDIIILQSDHGTKNLDKTRPNDAFQNYSAFYFPDRDYRLLYPGMSNANTFRIIFNKYFGQQLPLLKDSSIFIK